MAQSASPSPPGAIGQEAEVKFKAAQAKAKLGGVTSPKRIDALSLEQIKQLEGLLAPTLPRHHSHPIMMEAM